VAARILSESLVIAFFLLVGWTGYSVLEVLATDNLVSLPSIRVAWVQSVVPISAILIIVAEALTLPLALRLARAGHAAASGDASH
jgi:TRAP-type C4-dicarboxylate transport system permease small subunit